ncbi:unnamed protein product [Ectocarpus sp. CCAP 1310/34]|nr:unnamed protein product [Ectocarpus sp. CCAP 1310/34]
MKTATAMRTTACAACCGLAGVGAFLSAPSTSIVSSRNNPHTSSPWGNSALSSPLSLVGGGSGNARASVCPSPDGDGEGESRRDAAVKGGVRRHGGGGGGGSGGRRHRAATLGNLDLKPAYRLFDTVPPPPSTDATVRKSDDIDLDVDGDAPYDIDPFKLASEDLSPFTDTIKELVESEHPVLSMAAKHFFEKRHGKRFRPTIVALMALATCDKPMEAHRDSEEYTRQGQLGQITEMIHVASLIHDDVLDEAEVRRGGMAVHKLYSNKVAVLAGDYLLARASVLLARLGDVQVVEIMATALDSLVQGEIMQLKMDPDKLLDISLYLRKSYYKTASLITNACKSCAILGGHEFDSDVATAAEEYGYHMGLAFQIVDDILDIVGAADVLGKPAMADMSLGLATAPILYAAENAPEIKKIVKRRFKKEGDKEKALKAVLAGDAVARSRELARWHAQRAVDAVLRLPPSEARNGLVNICHIVLTRNK